MSEKTLKQRMCDGKNRYFDGKMAMEAAFRINARFIDCQSYYQCPFCREWHTSHSKNGAVRMIRKCSLVRPANPEDFKEIERSKKLKHEDLLEKEINKEKMLKEAGILYDWKDRRMKEMDNDQLYVHFIRLRKEWLAGKEWLKSKIHDCQDSLKARGVTVDPGLIICFSDKKKELASRTQLKRRIENGI